MKKFIFGIISMIAFIIVASEEEGDITFKVTMIKFISFIVWFVSFALFAKEGGNE